MSMAEEERDLRIELAEARTDTKFAQLLGELRTLAAGFNARLDAVEHNISGLEARVSGLKTTVIGTGIGVVAVVIGVLTYGQTWFGIGVAARDIIRATVSEYRLQQQPTLPAPSQAPSSPPK